jgi:hypothetical protein
MSAAMCMIVARIELTICEISYKRMGQLLTS